MQLLGPKLTFDSSTRAGEVRALGRLGALWILDERGGWKQRVEPLVVVGARAPPPPGIVSRRAPSAPAREALALAHFGHLLLAFGELISALLPRCRHHTPSGRPEPRGVASGGNASTSLPGAQRAATACEQRARGGSVPAQSSRSIGFLMLLGSSLTLCGIICNNNAMLSPGFLRYDPSKSNFRLLVTIVPSVRFAFLQTKHFKSRQSLSCLCGTAEAPLGMPEATPTTH